MVKNASNELKFGPEMYFYVFDQILEDLCKIFKIDQFMAEKLPFSVFFASRNRSQKMTKNALIKLKFGSNMYFYELNQIPEELCKIFVIDQFMAEKLSFSVFFASPNRSHSLMKKNVKKCFE